MGRVNLVRVLAEGSSSSTVMQESNAVLATSFMGSGRAAIRQLAGSRAHRQSSFLVQYNGALGPHEGHAKSV